MSAFSIALIAVVASLLVNLQFASADPSSGVGPLTVSDNGHWFEYSGNGEPYFMAGSGGPEGFLYYSDSEKQEIVDQLIANDVRAIYIHAVRSDGGDGGGDENPFFNNNADNGVDPAVLDEWDTYLSQLDEAGIVTWFHLYDDGARPFGACNVDLPEDEEQFVKTIVERFRGYQHLVWLPTEEHLMKACGDNSVDVEKAAALAAEIRKYDDVHPLGVHHNNGQSNQYLGNDDIDVFSQQICQGGQDSIDGIHEAGEFGEDVYVMAECHPWHKDLLDNGQRTTLRQSFWSSAMAGGYVLFYDAWESTDPTDGMLADLGRINEFMDTTRFAETAPADQLAAGGTRWVLANESSDIYITYSNNNPSTMGVKGISAGTYDLGWFDPATGVRVDESVSVDDGDVTFTVPNQIGSEVALSIEPSDGTTGTTTTTEGPTDSTTSTTSTSTTTTTVVTENPDVLEAVEDAFIEGTTAINHGELRVEAGSRTRTTYMQFDTSSVTSADDLRLRLTVGSDAGAGDLVVWLGDGSDWTEDTLTPANAPTPNEQLVTAAGSFESGAELFLPLSSDVLAGDTLNLVMTITGSGSDDVSFIATEGGDGPALLLDGPTGEPPTDDPPVDDPPVDDPDDDAMYLPLELSASDDAYVENSTAINTGQLRVEHGTRTRLSYLRFDTGPANGVQTAELVLTVGSDDGSGTVSLWTSTGGDWTEATLTPGNAPVPNVVVDTATGSFESGQQVTFSVPASAFDGEIIDLVISHDGIGADDLSFEATEGTDGPTLLVNGDVPVVEDPPVDDPDVEDPPVDDPDVEDPPVDDPDDEDPPIEDPPLPGIDTVTFQGTNANVPNPERGFHDGASVTDSTGGNITSVAAFESTYDDGIRIARMYIRLDDYRDSAIPQSLIDNLDEVFANARAGGIKLIPRFSYNFGSAPDASIERIEQHIDQVTPLLRRNSDVIAVLQSGFIGAWGEWHSSSNGLTNEEDRARVRDALLEALPADRMTQFRYPSDIMEMEPNPMTAGEAWTGSDASRSGHKNDCFLANEHDAGTYIPLSDKGMFQTYLEQMTAFTVMGGETCQVSAGNQRTDCSTALDELDRFNWDYLNIDFYGNTIDKWRTDGCFDEIEARLGYRFEMQRAAAWTTVQRGSELAVDLDVENVGFGKLYNPRPVNIVLVNNANGNTTSVEAVSDARTVVPLSGATESIDLDVVVPAGLAPGNYSIHVELPDGSASLADDARYSIQMANTGTWNAALGTNDLGLDVTVTN